MALSSRSLQRVAEYLAARADDALRRAPAPVRRAAIVAADYVRPLVAPVRMGQFVSVGVVGAICESLVLAGVVEAGLLSPVFAWPLSKETSIAVMFVLNERWTFADAPAAGDGGLPRRFLRSNLVRAGGGLTGGAVLVVLYRWFGVWYLLANTIGIGVGFFVNYVAENLVTWRVHEE